MTHKFNLHYSLKQELDLGETGLVEYSISCDGKLFGRHPVSAWQGLFFEDERVPSISEHTLLIFRTLGNGEETESDLENGPPSVCP